MATAKKPPPRSVGTATPWLEKIDAALAREKTWRDQGRKVVQRYRDERDKSTAANSSRINILWANKEVLQSALFARLPKPDIRRRFPDAKAGNSASRVAADVLERATMFTLDTEDVETVLSSAIEDLLLPGRGTVWVSYEPEIEEPEEDDVTGETEPTEPSVAGDSSVSARLRQDGGGNGDTRTRGADESVSAYASGGESTSAGGRIVSQRLCLEYVYWEDYCQGLARQDKHVPWKARRHAPSEDEFEVWFPDAGEVGASYKLRDASDQGGQQNDGEFVEVWEIWAKAGKKRLYVARGYADILEPSEDPYGLSTFYPTPRPLRSVTTTDTMIPRAEFLQYQDQANELDIVATRIRRLTQEIKFRGIYDATIPDGSAPGGSTLADMSKADDGEFLPHSSYQAIRDRGGIEAAFGFMPIKMLAEVVQELTARRAQLIEEIYQITGISDIVRGSTDPNETKGAQTLKAQFGGMRMNNRTREVQRFIRDAYRLVAEIIAEHFTQETLAEITGMDLPTKAEQMELQKKVAMLQQPPPMPGMGHNGGPPMSSPVAGPTASGGPPQPSQQPGGPPQPAPAAPDQSAIPPELIDRLNSPTWEDVMQILRSDKLRGYRVDIETDSTMEDADAEKQRRTEAGVAMTEMLEKAYVAATQAPETLPLIKELFLFNLRTFKAARSLEQAVEDAFDELQKNPPQPPGQPTTGIPPDQQAMIEQTKLATEEKKLNAETQYKAASLQLDGAHKQQIAQNDAQHKAGQLQIEQARLQQDGAHKAQMAQIEAAKLEHTKTAHAQTMNLEQQKLEQAKQTQAETMAHTKATSAADMNLRQAAHNKTMVDESAAAPTGDGQAQPNVLETIMSGLRDVIKTVTAGQEQVAQTLAAGQQQQAEQTAQLVAVMASPKRVVRGTDGKALGVETVTH